MTALILRADARALPLPDASADLIVTSPPYFALRSYTDGGESYPGQIGAESTPREYIAALLECTREWVRVLKPSGSLFVNLGDKYGGRAGGPQGKDGQRVGRSQAETYTNRLSSIGRDKSLMGLPWRYALACIDDVGLILRAEVIWSKPNGLPESVADRVRRSHEQWFHLTKYPRYFAAVDEIREPQVEIRRSDASWHDRRSAGEATRLGEQSTARRKTNRLMGHALGRLPGSVWEIPSEPLAVPNHIGADHFAAFPSEWPRRIITGWAPAGGVVLDPFGGTGTTALVAATLGRVGISVDRSADYCRIAEWRTNDPAQRAKVLGLAKPPVETAGQASLFDEDITEKGAAAA